MVPALINWVKENRIVLLNSAIKTDPRSALIYSPLTLRAVFNQKDYEKVTEYGVPNLLKNNKAPSTVDSQRFDDLFTDCSVKN